MRITFLSNFLNSKLFPSVDDNDIFDHMYFTEPGHTRIQKVLSEGVQI